MANRYWVGGAGTWDATTTTNWSATSGGAGGASAPTSVDNVIFNTLSNATAYAVTVGTNANAADVTIAGPAVGNVTITSGATAAINCYGSWTNAATGIVFTSTTGATVNFLATATGKTVTTNNVTFNAMGATFNSASGGWTLGSAATVFSINVVAGTFSTGNFNVTLGANLQRSATTGVATINLGSSTVTCGGSTPVSLSTTNLTFNAGTSTINCSNASPTFAGGGLTYYNVSFTSTAGSATIITGTNTFNNLTQTSPSSSRRIFQITNNQVINGTLTLGAANAYNARIFVQSDTAGTSRTLTVATIATLADVDFRDVTAAGASAPWSGTRLGNGLGNTSITFAAGKTVFWNLVAGGNWSANAWATSSGGAVATANFPLAQDTVIIDNTGLTASNTITMDSPWWMGTLNCTRTNAWTFNCTTSPFLYGDFTIPSVTTVTGTSALVFQGQGLTQTITTNSVSLTTPITITSVGGTVLLNGAVTTAATQTVTLTNGTLNLVSYTLTTGFFSSSNSNVRVLAFGTGKIVVTGNNGSVVNLDTATNFSFTGTSNIEGTYSGSVGTRTFVIGNTAGGSQAVALNLKVTAGTDIVNIYLHWNDLDFTGFSGTYGNPGNKIFYGSLTLSSGMTVQAATAQTITFAATSGPKTITSATKTIDYPVTFNGIGGIWACQDALTLGSTRALTFINGTLQLKAGTTSTVGSFVTSGTTLKYLQSTTPGTQATISDASGTDAVTYLSIQDSNATGGATWDATNPTNVYVTNNTGWNFGTLTALSGVAATGAVGSLVFSVDLSVTGVQATGTVGSVEFANAYTLSGVLSATAVDSVAPRFTVATTGVQATGAVGSVGFANAYILSGVQATGTVGAVEFANAYTLSGVQANGAVGNLYPGWYVIPNTQTPSWSNIATTQTPSWTNIIQS